jgi:hypothetical protein
VCENGALRRITGPKIGRVTIGWEKLRNEELHNLYSSANIIIMKSMWTRFAARESQIEEEDDEEEEEKRSRCRGREAVKEVEAEKRRRRRREKSRGGGEERREECMQNFGGETGRKQSTRKTKT